jgi:hypothetical protein
MTTHNDQLPEGENADDMYNSMKDRLDSINDGFKDMNKSLDSVERNLVTVINRMKATKVRAMIHEYEDGKRHEPGSEIAFFHRAVWTGMNLEIDSDEVVGFGYEYTRYAEDKVSRTEIKIQAVPDTNRTFVSFIEYDAEGDVTRSAITWTTDCTETMAYVAEYLGFDCASQIELE